MATLSVDPTMGEDGEEVMDHLTEKYGASAAKSFKDPNWSLATMGRDVGINWNYDCKMYNIKKCISSSNASNQKTTRKQIS